LKAQGLGILILFRMWVGLKIFCWQGDQIRSGYNKSNITFQTKSKQVYDMQQNRAKAAEWYQEAPRSIDFGKSTLIPL